MNFYESLGVKPSATASEIHAAYRKKAKQIHPDYNHKDSAFYEMVELNLIRDTLLNPEKRRQYDAQTNHQNPVHLAQDPPARKNLVQHVRDFFSYRCRTCGLKMSSTWQGYCLYHFLEVSGQLDNPDQTFIYQGITYTWQAPNTSEDKPQPYHFSPIYLILYVILCLAITALIIYNIHNLW
jgi:curved DNA-binding protein CbpA